MNKPITWNTFKEVIPFMVLFGTLLYSYFSTNATSDKNYALLNQQLNMMNLTLTNLTTQINGYGDRITRLEVKLSDNRVSVATMAAPLLSKL